jgi:hypothetical protein
MHLALKMSKLESAGISILLIISLIADYIESLGDMLGYKT